MREGDKFYTYLSPSVSFVQSDAKSEKYQKIKSRMKTNEEATVLETVAFEELTADFADSRRLVQRNPRQSVLICEIRGKRFFPA